MRNQSLPSIGITLCSLRDVRSPSAKAHHYVWSAISAAYSGVEVVSPVVRGLGRIPRRIWDDNRERQELRLARLIRDRGRRDSPILMLNCAGLVGRLGSEFSVPYFHFSDLTARQLRADYARAFSSQEAFERAQEVDRQSARGAKLCLYPSKWAAQDAIDAYGLEPDRVVAIPRGGGMEEHAVGFRVPETRWDNPVLEMLCIGNDAHRKGFDTAIDAAARLQRSGVRCRLSIIGVDQWSEAPENVIFMGRLRQDRSRDMDLMLRVLRRSMVLLHPARGEAYGQALVEAMSFGIPIVGTRVGAMPELIEHPQTGVLINQPGDVSEVVEAVYDLSRDRERMREMGVAARARWNARLRWRNWVSRFAESISRGAPASVRTNPRAAELSQNAGFGATPCLPGTGA